MFYNSKTYKLGYICGYIYCVITIIFIFIKDFILKDGAIMGPLATKENLYLFISLLGIWFFAIVISVAMLIIGFCIFIFKRKAENKDLKQNIIVKIVNTIMFAIYIIFPFILIYSLFNPNIVF